MLIETIEVGDYLANCYVVSDGDSGRGTVIDPGDEAERILGLVESRGLTVESIVLTHGHLDHIGAVRKLKELTGASLLAHRDEARLLGDPAANMSAFTGRPVTAPEPDRLLDGGDKIPVGELTFEVLHTPGHSPGGICLYAPGIVFSGDTLFFGSIGRTDFPGCDHQTLIRSIESRLMTLPDETIVYPGHGPATSIGHERKTNPFLTGAFG